MKKYLLLAATFLALSTARAQDVRATLAFNIIGNTNNVAVKMKNFSANTYTGNISSFVATVRIPTPTGAQPNVITTMDPGYVGLNIATQLLQNGGFNYYTFSITGTSPVASDAVFAGGATTGFDPNEEVNIFSIRFAGRPDIITTAQLYDDDPFQDLGEWYFQVGGVTHSDNNNEFYANISSLGLLNDGGNIGVSVVGLANVALPVKLSAFTAKKAENRVVLNWTTNVEQNIAQYEIERSADGNNFNKSVAAVAATGNSINPQEYQAFDNSPLNGVNYYRLKMIEVNGAYTYSPVQTVSFESGRTTYTLSPNPAMDAVSIRGAAAGNIIQIINNAGQSVSQTVCENELQKINVSLLVPGIYFVQVQDAGKIVYSTKFVKQ